MIAVDDVQWSDPPSLRFLAYLSRRLEGMTVVLLVAVRTGDPQVDASLVAELVSGPGVRAGHTSVSFTLDRYGHLYPESDTTLRDRLEALHSSVRPADGVVIQLPQ
jgi:hypothetical protein